MTYIMICVSHAVSRPDVKKAFIFVCIVLTVAVAVGYSLSYVKQKELQTANKCEKINFILYFVTVLFLW